MDLDLIEKTIREGMAAAAESPGLYGGRYVGRYFDRKTKDDVYLVLDHDEPNKIPGHIDVLCHATPKRAFGMGRARYWINEDGSVNRAWFEEKRPAATSAPTTGSAHS